MSDFATFILEILLYSPLALPYQILEASSGPPCGWSFAAAPFAKGAVGYLEPAACAPGEPPESADARPHRMPGTKQVAGQIGLEGLAAIDGTYGRLQARARFLTVSRLEVDAAYADYLAPPGGDLPAWIGQTHLDLRFAQSERVEFRVGAGVRDRFVGGKGFVGFDALYGIDVFWPRGLSTSLEASGGTLGVNGWAAEARGTAGYLIGFVELFAGWDALWLGAPRKHTEDLGGPVLGARAYF